MKAVRIETNEKDEIVIKRLNYNRFEFYGFGSFLWKVKKEEISISKKAIELLKPRVGDEYSSLGDLAGISLDYNTTALNKDHRGYSINYGFLGPELNVPPHEVIIDLDFYDFLRDIPCEDKDYELDKEDQLRWENIEKLEEENKEEEIEKIIENYYNSSK